MIVLPSIILCRHISDKFLFIIWTAIRLKVNAVLSKRKILILSFVSNILKIELN